VNASGYATSTQTCNVYATNIIVSGGTFGTPKLLQLSGVGPRSTLESLGIPVVVDSPFVGTNYDDQMGARLPIVAPNIPTPGRATGYFYWNVEDDPNLELNIQNNLLSHAGVMGGIVYLTYAQSKGVVNISTTDADIHPSVYANYLATPRDWYVLSTGLEQNLQLVKALNWTISPDPCATGNCSTPREQLITYLTTGHYIAGNHWSATAGVGRVLDPETMAVIGASNLYVVDSSAFVRSPGCSTQWTAFAVGERGIELVLADIQNKCNSGSGSGGNSGNSGNSGYSGSGGGGNPDGGWDNGTGGGSGFP